MPAFQISFRPAISSPHHPMLTDELITPDGWDTTRAREYFRVHNPHTIVYACHQVQEADGIPA